VHSIIIKRFRLSEQQYTMLKQLYESEGIMPWDVEGGMRLYLYDDQLEELAQRLEAFGADMAKFRARHNLPVSA
jgi:hypothetical protein